MNLSQRFLQYLKENQTTEFTTRDALNWYEFQRQPGLKPARHSDLNFLIITPLIQQKKIKRIAIGYYLVLNRSSSELPTTTNSQKDELNQEDREFFQYLESKLKKGGP